MSSLSPESSAIPEPRPPRKTRWLPIVIALALIAFLVYTTQQETGMGVGLDPATIPPPTLGSADARVEIVVYADLGCPVCRTWHTSGIRDAILAEYGDQVRFVWRDFPVITPQSPQAAEAAHCAAAQGEFWDYLDVVYGQYAGVNPDALRGYATQVGLDMAAFDGCLERGDMRQVVQANDRMARQLGLRGTPGFTLNGQPLPAPPNLEQLSARVAQELARGDN